MASKTLRQGEKKTAPNVKHCNSLAWSIVSAGIYLAIN
jgi:hypothetical protein